MSVRPDGPHGGHPADHILNDALKAQLALLDAFFSLQGWMVARHRGTEFCVLAAHGAWRTCGGLKDVGDFMQGRWVAYSGHPGFQYRDLDGAEKARLDELLPATSMPDCIIRRPLRDPEGHVQAWLIGVANQKTIDKVIEPRFPVDSVTQAVIGMTLSLALHADLRTVQNQLIELQQNAFTEPLTRVLNRAGWINRVQHLEAIIARSEEDVAIVMLDLDLLKLVNDLDGHSAGDELLQLTAQTIQSVVRRSDVVGRLGGDEFGVAVRGVTPSLARSLVGRLRAALDEVGVNVSIGMAMKSEAGGLDDTFVLADRRMYDEKRAKPMPDRAMKWQRSALNPHQPQNLDSHS